MGEGAVGFAAHLQEVSLMHAKLAGSTPCAGDIRPNTSSPMPAYMPFATLQEDGRWKRDLGGGVRGGGKAVVLVQVLPTYLQSVGCSSDCALQNLLVSPELHAVGLVHCHLTHSRHHTPSHASQPDLVIVHLHNRPGYEYWSTLSVMDPRFCTCVESELRLQSPWHCNNA